MLAALAAPGLPVLTASHGPPCPHPEPLSCGVSGMRIVAVRRCLAKARAGRPQRAWEAPGLRGSGAASAASFDN